MGNPTSGVLCLSNGLHLLRCNPSFVWSDDSRYLAVPQFFQYLGVFARQRLLIVAMEKRTVYASRRTAYYFQPDTFHSGDLRVTIDPSERAEVVMFHLPADIASKFQPVPAPWPEAASTPQNEDDDPEVGKQLGSRDPAAFAEEIHDCSRTH
jgi:hypothetical protein